MKAPKGGPRRAVFVPMKPVAAAVAAAVGTISLPAAAQDNIDEVGFLEEITVTATRRDTGIQEIPYNISAISGADLDDLRITDIGQLARWVPGMVLVDQGPRAASPLIMRGVSTDSLSASEFLGNNNGGTVATYIGEVPLYIDMDMRDMERVEILRGPQGTLFGAGSLAGAVRYIPNKPDTSDFSTDLHARTYTIEDGDGVSYDLDLVLNAPIIKDRLAFRGLFGYVKDQGFIDQPYLVRQPGVSIPEPDFSNPQEVQQNLFSKEDTNSFETTIARLSLLWDISNSWESTLSYHYQRQDVDGRQVNHTDSLQVIQNDQGIDIPNGNNINGHRVLEPNDRKNQIFELDFVGDLGFAEFTSATGYSRYDEEGQRDQTDLLLTFGFTYADFPQFTAFTAEDQEDKTITQEFRLVSTADSPLTWIAGAFYRHYESDLTSLEFTPGLYDFGGVPQPPPPLPNNLEYIQVTGRTLDEWAVFGEIGYDISDAWNITLGARYFQFSDEFEQAIGFPYYANFNPDFALQGSRNSSRDDDSIFKFNLSYNVTDDAMTYLTISEGFRLGGSNGIQPCVFPIVNPNLVCGDPAAGQVQYKPDTSVNYELGLRSTWLDGSMVLNSALFYIDWKDIQAATTSLGGSFPIIVNGNKAESKGVELEWSWQFAQRWLLRASYAYTNAELSEDSDKLAFDPTLGVGTAKKGDRLPGTPEHQGALLLNYTQPLQNGWDLLAEYGLTTQSDVYTQLGIGSACCRLDPADPAGRPGPGEALPGFTIHNASVTLAGDQWSVQLFADNLFDKQAVTGVRTDSSYVGRAGGGADYALRRYYNYVVTPRVIGLDFRYRVK